MSIKCKKCNDTGLYVPEGTCYYNCEGGGDCEKDFPGWTREICKTCGKLKCDCEAGKKAFLLTWNSTEKLWEDWDVYIAKMKRR